MSQISEKPSTIRTTMSQTSQEVSIVPQSKSSIWKVALSGLSQTFSTQRRESTRIITDIVHSLDDVIECEDNVLARTLRLFENATHISRRYLIIGAFFFAVCYLCMGRSAGVMCNVLGTIYPIYASIKAAGQFLIYI